jgi:hypothetical protein
MARAKGVRAGRAFVELFADDTQLARALKRAQKRLSAFGDSARAIGARFTAIGGAALAGFGAAIGVFVKAGDALDKMSLRTGLSVEALSELEYAASQSGASMEDVEKGVRTMQRTINDAERGLSTATEAFEELGLSAEQLRSLTPEKQFTLIADRISKIEDPSKRAAIAMQVLGKSGSQLLPLMLNGAAGIEALRKQARDLGLTISTETAQDAARLGDRLDDLRRVLRATVIVVGATLAPAVEAATKRITRIAVVISSWIKANRETVVLAAKVALAIFAVGAAFLAIGSLAAIAAFALGGIVSAISAVGAIIGGVITVLGAVLSPIGLVVAAIAAATFAFFRFTKVGQDALAFLQARFRQLADVVGRTLGGVRDALSAGDIDLAARVLWSGLRVVWLEGTKEIRDTFAGGLVVMRRLLLSASIGMQKIWASFSSGVRSAWEVTQNWLAKRFIELQGIFDDSLDVEAAKRGLEELSQTNLSSIAKQAEDALNALDKEQSRREQDILDNAVDRLDERRKALEDAKRDLDKAIDDARRKREDADAADAARPTPAFADRFADIGERVASEARIEARGTFNASAVQGLATNSQTAERTAKAAEETARHTRRLVERAQAGGLTFA